AVLAVIAAATAAAECAGIPVPEDDCASIIRIISDILAEFINFLRSIVNSIPIVGAPVGNPIIDLLDQARVNLTSGSTAAVGDTISLVKAIVLTFQNALIPLAPEPLKTQLNNAFEFILGLLERAAHCFGTTNACDALFNVAADVINSLLGLFGDLPVLGIVLDPVATALQGLVNALRSGAVDAVQTALGLITVPLNALLLVPGIGTNPIIQSLQGTLQILNDCVV
ncbi:hypothetical protein BGZ73_008805, partial [Actinomortierella ambigua]